MRDGWAGGYSDKGRKEYDRIFEKPKPITGEKCRERMFVAYKNNGHVTRECGHPRPCPYHDTVGKG